MAAKDHTVPQMYLKRFAARRKTNAYFTQARAVGRLDDSFLTSISRVAALDGFYSVTHENGEVSTQLEHLFESIETAADPAFRALLDVGDFAFPTRWPGFPDEYRQAISWFVSAQILRTTRQRKRLAWTEHADRLPLPNLLKDSDLGNDHARFIIERIAELAQIIHSRPWGLGMVGACTFTSDTPVVILNDHDAQDQLRAATFWEIILPLDPHRILFLPSIPMVEQDARKSADHRFVIEDWPSVAIGQAIYDAADSYVFFHPDHVPVRLPEDWGRLPEPGSAKFGLKNEWYMDYEVLPVNATILRKYVSEHPPPRD